MQNLQNKKFESMIEDLKDAVEDEVHEINA